MPKKVQIPTRKKDFQVPPDVAFLLLDKVLTAERKGVSLADRDQYKQELPVGTHSISGSLKFDINYTVGEDSTAVRSYGVPTDKIILLSFLYSGAFREQLLRAALVVREIRTAELEERRVRSIRYTYDRIVEEGEGYRLEPTRVQVKAMDVAREATRLGLKLIGEYPEFKDDPKETQRRQLIAAQIANCLGTVKVNRPYDGPININDVTITVEKDAAVADEEKKAA